MSQLFVGTDADELAGRLLDDIEQFRRTADPFVPVAIVVPNRFVQQWLRFRMARAWGVVLNVQFIYLEQALWDGLREIDPRTHEFPPELLDEERFQFLVLDPEAPLDSRLECRRAWQSAGRLMGLIREYEYHRQDQIIQPWLAPVGVAEVPPAWREREAAQRAVFRAVTAEATGRRATLNRELKRNFKTLPQYVMEMVHEVQDRVQPPRRVIHLFGLSQISPLHVRAIELLEPFHDWRAYHLNPLASRLPGGANRASLQQLARTYRREERPDDRPGTELLHVWGRAAAESLDLTARVLRRSRVRLTLVQSRKNAPQSPTVLGRLQEMVLGSESDAEAKLPQDASLQIVRCPGIWREVETIHAAIVNLLAGYPALRQSDIAVLVTDMSAYRPVLTAVFDRPPARLSYTLADYSAARVSAIGQALLGMFDLALEGFSRTRVFEVLLNPCVLARLGIRREEALHWLTWAESLGIYRGWESVRHGEPGEADSPLYSWKLGLRRLRLGQYMDVARDDSSEPAPQWRGVVPFADVDSVDRAKLDQFCRVVEGLLPLLARLAGLKATGREWSEAALSMMQRFLAVPDDRPEEEAVRDALIVSLRRLAEWDVLHGADGTLIPIGLVREIVASRLQSLSGHRSEFLTSGVTIAELKSQRPIPFEIVFIAGMGERRFPGAAAVSPLDLRQIRRFDGDVLPVEQKRDAFLEAILSARQKLVITYDGRDLQKDEELQPSVPLAQLRRFVAQRVVVGGEFQIVRPPLLAHDSSYIDPAEQPDHQDVLFCESNVDRVLALDAVDRSRGLEISANHRSDLARQRERLLPSFSPSVQAQNEPKPTPTVSLSKLRKFLENPAEAALRYHLRAADEWDEGGDEDFEPLTSSKFVGNRLVTATLQRIVQRSITEAPADLAATWAEEFDRRYREGTQRCQLPAGGFGEVDAGALRQEVDLVLNDGGLLAFLAAQSGKPACGPYLIGSSETPVGARRRVDALALPLARTLAQYSAGEFRIVSAWPFAWRDETSLDLLVFHQDKFDPKKPLSRRLFEPLLFVSALSATGDLGSRTVTLHLVCPEGLTSVCLEGSLLEQNQARTYLAELATDFLDVRCADQIPFELLLKKEWARVSAEDFGSDFDAGLLADWRWREDSGEWDDNCGGATELSELGFRVPDDLGAKVRRRFRPLAILFPAPAPKKTTRKGRKGAGE